MTEIPSSLILVVRLLFAELRYKGWNLKNLLFQGLRTYQRKRKSRSACAYNIISAIFAPPGSTRDSFISFLPSVSKTHIPALISRKSCIPWCFSPYFYRRHIYRGMHDRQKIIFSPEGKKKACLSPLRKDSLCLLWNLSHTQGIRDSSSLYCKDQWEKACTGPAFLSSMVIEELHSFVLKCKEKKLMEEQLAWLSSSGSRAKRYET